MDVLIQEMLFVDDAALASHNQEDLQHLMDILSKACSDFGLTISMNKTKAMAQVTGIPQAITIGDTMLQVVDNFR